MGNRNSFRQNETRHSVDGWVPRDQLQKQVQVRLEVYRNPNPTKIEERNDKIFIFMTPTMRAKATVTAPPVPIGQVWTIGWVQSCYFMNFANVYSTIGFSSWEFPQLNVGLPGVNDSDGQSYPFYGHDREIFQLAGPISQETTFTVAMSDSPASHVTLKAPTRHPDCSPEGLDLTCIKRKQKFFSWLVAFNEVTGDCIELKCLSWDCDIHIQVEPRNPCGTRGFLKEPLIQDMPRLVTRLPPIPKVAKLPPDANHAQMLVWRPFNSNLPQNFKTIRILVPPHVRDYRVPTERELKNPQVYELANECNLATQEFKQH